MSQINVNTITGKDGGSAVNFPNGITVTGVVTATSLNQNTSGNITAASFTGPLTGDVTGNLTGNVTGNVTGTADLASGLTGTPNITVGTVTGTDATFSGNLTVQGTTTTIDTAVTDVDSLAIDGNMSVGGTASFKGVTETVNVGSYAGGILTLDAATGTVFTHDLQGQTVGIVSITNFPVVTNSFHTVTVIYNQNSAGTGNTTATTGVSTNITLNPAGASGFSTTGLCGTGTTVTLSTTAEDFDIVTYGIHYNGSGSGAVGNYKVFVTKSGDFRY
jgi:hypothetical protein